MRSPSQQRRQFPSLVGTQANTCELQNKTHRDYPAANPTALRKLLERGGKNPQTNQALFVASFFPRPVPFGTFDFPLYAFLAPLQPHVPAAGLYFCHCNRK